MNAQTTEIKTLIHKAVAAKGAKKPAPGSTLGADLKAATQPAPVPAVYIVPADFIKAAKADHAAHGVTTKSRSTERDTCRALVIAALPLMADVSHHPALYLALWQAYGFAERPSLAPGNVRPAGCDVVLKRVTALGNAHKASYGYTSRDKTIKAQGVAAVVEAMQQAETLETLFVGLANLCKGQPFTAQKAERKAQHEKGAVSGEKGAVSGDKGAVSGEKGTGVPLTRVQVLAFALDTIQHMYDFLKPSTDAALIGKLAEVETMLKTASA